MLSTDQEDIVASGGECAASMNNIGCLPRAYLLIRHRDSCGIGVETTEDVIRSAP